MLYEVDEGKPVSTRCGSNAISTAGPAAVTTFASKTKRPSAE
jgi:hypothetical protein